MKRLLIGLALFAAACSGSLPTDPSGTKGTAPQTSQPTGSEAGSPTVDPVPGGPGANSPTPVATLTGPRDCVTAGTDVMRWVLSVTDAGPSALRFMALAHQDDSPGCSPTNRNPRARVDISGVTAYAPHSNGQTIFTFDPKLYSCGRVQVDASILDAAGNELLVVGMMIDYGTVCTPPPPTALVCSPPTQTVSIGQPASVTCRGGTGTYAWTAPGSSTPAGAGSTIATAYPVEGTYTITVTSGTETVTCHVIVSAPPPPLICSPPTQLVNMPPPIVPHVPGPFARVSATGGTGTYAWSAPGGVVTTGVGPQFRTLYEVAGIYTITVTSGTQTATCQVVVPPTPETLLECTPPTQTVNIGQMASVSCTGGTRAYTWSAPGASTTTGAGSPFTTSYPVAGNYTITVISGTQSGTHQVIVEDSSVPARKAVASGIRTRPLLVRRAEGQSVRWSVPIGRGRGDERRVAILIR